VTPDPHGILRNKVLETVLSSPGKSDPSTRRQAFGAADVPAELRSLIEKIEANAYKVTDEDLTRLKGKYTDDQLFEIIVAAALGAAERRLLAGLDALNDV
jgi:hypothetical protein